MLSSARKLRGTGSRGLYRALKICSFRGTAVSFSLPMVLCCLLWLLAGQFSFLPAMILNVLWHEASHAVTAHYLGYTAQSITVYPFGGCAVIPLLDKNAGAEILSAAAGPLGSLLAAFAWQTGEQHGLLPDWPDFTACARDMAMINLLPLEPLDGGRILRALLSESLGEKKGLKIARRMKSCLLAVLILYALYRTVFFLDGALLPCSAFLWLAGGKNEPSPVYRHTLWREAERVRVLKAEEKEPLAALYARLTGRFYYLILVIGPDGHPLGMLAETAVEEGLRKNTGMTAGEAVRGTSPFAGQWPLSEKYRRIS